MKVGIVAGEPSGDYLAAGLMKALKRRIPDVEFVGVGGPCMQAVGLDKLYTMDRISIMGLEDLLTSIYDILRVRRSLFRQFATEPVSLFIGVDVPDFNTGLEHKLRKNGITTIHYVSPTVWAWRTYRIRKIKRAVSHMLTLFPFEAAFYEHHQVPVSFVGHPIADEIEITYDKQEIRRRLSMQEDDKLVVALLPGSRMVEIKRLGDLFIQTALALRNKIDNLVFVAPFANSDTRQYFSILLEAYPGVYIKIEEGNSRQVLAASDVALVASGTAALEAALLKVPVVVAYKGSWLSYSLVKLLAHIKYFSMPNNLLEKPIVPEFIQSNATVENLVAALADYLLDPVKRRQVENALGAIISMLRRGANEKAATAVCEVLARKSI